MGTKWDNVNARATPDPQLLEYCESDKQKEYISAWIEFGTSAAAAKELGCNDYNVRACKKLVESKAAKKGWQKSDNHIPDGYKLKGKSTLLDSDGNAKIQWVKTEVDKERQEEMMRELCDNLKENIKPWPVVKAPKKVNADLCSVYTITDYHIGAYSWNEETGADWDIKIAEDTLYKAFGDMINGTPDSEQAVFVQMGDFLHWDGLTSVTPLNRHVLDSDGRYPKLVQVAVETCVRAVEMLLHKHKHVHVVMCEGNHDLTGSVWLQAIMKMAFKKNKRVTVDDSVFPYYSFTWGNVFLGWHHGHLTKIRGLAGKFFSEPRFRGQMANTEHIYISTGHYHTKEVVEVSGVVIERHPTLNARDAYGARGFEHSQRGALAITYDKEKGEISRVTVTP
ncbi:winged helix-turn-helix domain-containing protein [bacterium]|nr:winged helix-turn-helix domain-containing protein [bacterium]